jgi:hypothetical protein
MARHFQLISEMSTNDLATLGHTLEFAPTLDNPRSARYQPTYASTAKSSGNGYSNNLIFGSTSDVQTGIPTTSLAFGNTAGQYKIGRYVDLSNKNASGIYGATGLMTSSQLNTEFRPYYTTSGNLMIWHDYAVIKLKYLFESLNKIGLVKRFDAQLRLWVNTGTVNVFVADADAANTAYNLIPSNNTFSNTCPLIVNYQEGSGTSGASFFTNRYKKYSCWSLYI